MHPNIASASEAPPATINLRWFVCALLFLATTINYLDRSVISLIEPVLHTIPFMGWNPAAPTAAQPAFNNNFGNILICFQIAYGIGFLTAGRLIDRLGTKTGYALAILLWSTAAMAHALVGSVAGFCAARFLLGLGEAGNFPAAIKAITEWFPADQRALATGLFNSGTNAASLLAPWLLPIITLRFGWHAAFLSTGTLGLLWLALWLPFPYNRLRPNLPSPNASSRPEAQPERRDPRTSLNSPHIPGAGAPSIAQPHRDMGGIQNILPAETPIRTTRGLYPTLLRQRGTWAFSTAKFLTDPVWWFYLFWLPKYFHETYSLTLTGLGPPIIAIYFCSSFGSVAGGWLSGHRIRRLRTSIPTEAVPRGRRFALLLCALCALPVMLVPLMARILPGNVWPAVALLALAAAAHQGWSANLYTAPTDIFPATAVSTVIGIGSAAGALGGALFTWLTKTLWNSHPFTIFFLAAIAYTTAFLLFRRLSPPTSDPALP